MTVALIRISPPTVLGIFSSVPNPLILPNGDQVGGADVGWGGGGYSLVAVAPFITPAGQENVGGPSYAIVGDAVIETYATQAIPAPVPTCQVWQLKAVLTAAQTTAVESAIAASPNTAALQAFWATGDAPVPANSTTLLALGAVIGLSAAQVAALVTAASEVSIP